MFIWYKSYKQFLDEQKHTLKKHKLWDFSLPIKHILKRFTGTVKKRKPFKFKKGKYSEKWENDSWEKWRKMNSKKEKYCRILS